MAEEPELVRRALSHPRIRVNQHRYPPDGPKLATWIADSQQPHRFSVRTRGGEAAFQGWTEPAGRDEPSGFQVQRLDFTDLTTPGEYRLAVDGSVEAVSPPVWIASDGFEALARDALAFFYAQRSGTVIWEEILPGYARPAGHIGVPPNQGDNAVPAWTGPDAELLYPGWRCPGSFDVTGGWYDAGDHGKYVPGGGLSAGLLLAAHERLLQRPGARSMAPRGAEPSLLEEALWEVDWMSRMQVPAGLPHAGMAFHRVHDDHWTAFPLAPAEDPARRVLHRPSTAAALNLSAVAAQAARTLAGSRPGYAERLLAAARRAYLAAAAEPNLYAPDDQGAYGGGPYNDDQVADEFYWAATELFLTTGEGHYLDDLTSSPCHQEDVFDLDGFDWDTVAAFARLQLAAVPCRLPDRDRVRASVIAAADRLRELQAGQPWGQPYAPADGWDWGSNGRILSNLIVLASAHDLTGDGNYHRAVLSGLDYLLGRNPVGMSYVTGYGTEYAHRQRVRHFAHTLDSSYPPPPPGSLAGGPASKAYPGFPGDPRFAGLPPQLCYVDEPTSETTNDVCVRWNASLVWVGTYLAYC
jgi:endoglucanase